MCIPMIAIYFAFVFSTSNSRSINYEIYFRIILAECIVSFRYELWESIELGNSSIIDTNRGKIRGRVQSVTLRRKMNLKRAIKFPVRGFVFAEIDFEYSWDTRATAYTARLKRLTITRRFYSSRVVSIPRRRYPPTDRNYLKYHQYRLTAAI